MWDHVELPRLRLVPKIVYIVVMCTLGMNLWNSSDSSSQIRWWKNGISVSFSVSLLKPKPPVGADCKYFSDSRMLFWLTSPPVTGHFFFSQCGVASKNIHVLPKECPRALMYSTTSVEIVSKGWCCQSPIWGAQLMDDRALLTPHQWTNWKDMTEGGLSPQDTSICEFKLLSMLWFTCNLSLSPQIQLKATVPRYKSKTENKWQKEAWA